MDQQPPDDLGPVNLIRVPHLPSSRAAGDRRRARILSDLVRGLMRVFDLAIATDVDEFLVLDPAAGRDLASYLCRLRGPIVSAMGLDVGQHLTRESPLDPNRPFLDQRRFAHVSARFTKPVVVTMPVTWGSGLHRVKGRNFRIDPNLYLFHFGMVDDAFCQTRQADSDRLHQGWAGHLRRRARLPGIITAARPADADRLLPWARLLQTWRRSIIALNKPGMLPGRPVIEIPERFRGLV